MCADSVIFAMGTCCCSGSYSDFHLFLFFDVSMCCIFFHTRDELSGQKWLNVYPLPCLSFFSPVLFPGLVYGCGCLATAYSPS